MEDKNTSQSAKITTILDRLDSLISKSTEHTRNTAEDNLSQEQLENKQTVSDDFKVDDSKEKMILSQEKIIRSVLALYNINYDDLIKLDGKSAYCKAIQFYPHLKDEVKKAECPPLMALQVAKLMKPYLDFTLKYGSSLEDIKQTLKQEIENEKQKPHVPKKQISKPIEQLSIFADMETATTSNNLNKATENQNNDSVAFLFNR